MGYLAQGGAKFAGYEYWKKTFVQVVGSQEEAVKNRTLIYLGSAAIAECVILFYFFSGVHVVLTIN